MCREQGGNDAEMATNGSGVGLPSLGRVSYNWGCTDYNWGCYTPTGIGDAWSPMRALLFIAAVTAAVAAVGGASGGGRCRCVADVRAAVSARLPRGAVC